MPKLQPDALPPDALPPGWECDAAHGYHLDAGAYSLYVIQPDLPFVKSWTALVQLRDTSVKPHIIIERSSRGRASFSDAVNTALSLARELAAWRPPPLEENADAD